MKYTKKEVDEAFEDCRLITIEERELNEREIEVASDRIRVHKAKQLAFARLREVTSN